MTSADAGSGRRCDLDEVLDLALRVLDQLIPLHDRGRVHRSVMPANLRDGILVDPGVEGTFGYLAPEQLVGDATAMSDLYGLGATLVHLLDGVHPKHLALDRRLTWSTRTGREERLMRLLADLLEPDPEVRARAVGSTRAVRERVYRLRHPPQPSRVVRWVGSAASGAALGLGVLVGTAILLALTVTVAVSDPRSPGPPPTTALELRVRVDPVQVDAPGQDPACEVMAEVDQDGIPHDPIADCPPPFADAARAALLRWRWAPRPGEGRATVRVRVPFAPSANVAGWGPE